MRLKALQLFNFGPFKGHHVLDLRATTYAVTARQEADDRRSNWTGKSMLCEAVMFAEHGWLNPARGFLADDWVSDGERSGFVAVEYDDGFVIKRSKLRGKREELIANGAVQVEAQAEIVKRIGLTCDDALATTYLPQRQMARFVLAAPGERMKVVGDWLRLERLEAAEKRAKAALSESVRVYQLARADVQAATDAHARALEGQTLEAIEEGIRLSEEAASAAREELAGLQVRWRAAVAAKQGLAQVDEYEKIATEGRALKTELAGVDGAALAAAALQAHEALTASRVVLAEAQRDSQQKQKLAKGRFDGVCPVAGIACPAKDQINADADRNDGLLRTSVAAYGAATTAHHAANQAEVAAQARAQEYQRKRERLAALVERARQMKPQVEAAKASPAVDLNYLSDRERAAQAKIELHVQAAADLRARLTTVERSQVAARTKLANEREASQRLAGAVLAIFRDAKQRVAESAVFEIEAGANAALASCGVDLTVGVSWAREGKDLAKDCDACGTAFPSSAKAKKCERCGAERGKHLVQRLDVLLSKQSGAAEDLAGIALQLAASRWLREDRGSPYAFACMDEPTGAFDPAIRQAFARGLPKMLAAAGVRQAFVVSHSSDVLDSLPGRIEIVGDGTWAVPRVIA